MRTPASLCLAIAIVAVGDSLGDESYFSPAIPPSSHYVIDARIDLAQDLMEGRETVSLKNPSRVPISVVAFDWSSESPSSLEVAWEGKRLYPPPESPKVPQKGPLFVRLVQPLAPDAQITLEAKFRVSGIGAIGPEGVSTSQWYPRLWWDGMDRHDSYSVKLDVPENLVLAASGRLDPKTKRYEARAAATFGIYLATGVKTATREVDGVLITSVFTEKGARAANVCLETAADAVHFYRNWLGFYPFPFLTIIPGGPNRNGGYPVATGIVAIHGQETYVEGESPQHWQFITSHEIGHQYWGEWVLDPDKPPWLWIAMGIFADSEFMTVRGFDPDRRAKWMGNYLNAIPMYYDTTLDILPAEDEKIQFDRNNVVIHSKGPAAIYALDSILGRDLFLRIYKKCLHEFAGRGLAWKEFERICESESGQNLRWFFDSWIRSNQYLCYTVESRECQPGAGGYRCFVNVKRSGSMAMPLLVKATFEDGTEQASSLDRTKTVTRLEFTSRARLRDVILDPDRRMAMVKWPIPEISVPAAARLAYGWTSKEAPDLYAVLRKESIPSAAIWYRLGSQLYDADRLPEALDCFAKIDGLEADRLIRYAARGWRGLIEDLRGNRDAALERYKEALQIDPGETMNLSGQRIQINRRWLETRLQKPFVRESEVSLPERPAAADLISAVARMGYYHEGKTPLVIFERTRGLEIRSSDFWFKLGLQLFDSGFYRESLASFEQVTALTPSGLQAFAAWAWQGHMHDLLGDREPALACYRAALKLDTGGRMQHSQSQMVIDREWIEARLRSPFTWSR